MTRYYYKIFFICNDDNCNEIYSEDDLNTREYKMPLDCKACGNNAFYINLGYDKKDSNRKVAKITKSNKLKTYKCREDEITEYFGNNEGIVYTCDKCGETLDVKIDSEFLKIPFEGTWRCKCENVIRVKWNGTELTYL